MKRIAASIPHVALWIGLFSCVAPGDPHDLGPLFQEHDHHAVQVAALVVDLDTGATLFSREANRLVRPASTMKLLTTAAVCRRAPDGELQTTLSADVLPEGVVTLTGGADPFLSAADLRTLVVALQERGLLRVSGNRVRVVDPLLGAGRFGEGWMWDDEPATFMPAITAVPVDGGCVTVLVRDTGSGLEAELQPVAGSMQLRVLPGPGRLRVTRGRYAEPHQVTVSGSLTAEQSVLRRRISVPDPARFTGEVLAGALEQEGLFAKGPVIFMVGSQSEPASEGHRVTLRRPIAEVVQRTNKASDNLGAELLLRWLATLNTEHAALEPGAEVEGIAAIGEDLTSLGLDPGDYRISDGSGVSHYSLISAEVLVRTLEDMHRVGGRSREVFVQSLPVAGKDGTLANRMQGTVAEGRVQAKTGTISGVSNLAGYVTTKSGRRLAFAILVQNFVGSAAPWRALQDSFCARLAEL